MKQIEIHSAIKTPIVILLMFLTAFFTPWWGTIVIVAILSLLIGISMRGIALMTMCGWMAACALRDVLNQFGPSRVFTRIFQLEQIGLPFDSIQSRLTVYVGISLTGFLLAYFTAGIFKSIRSFFPSISLR